MKSLPSFLIATLLFGLCLIEKRSKEKAIESSFTEGEVSIITKPKPNLVKTDSSKLEAMDIQKFFVFNFVYH